MNKNIYRYFFPAIVWLCLFSFSSFLLAETRTALVIGNGGYQAVSPLKNPPNDARAIAAALQATGFTVDLRLDANQQEMESAIQNFGNTLRSGGVGMFYFAGHGLQVKGSNYLVPVGAGAQIKNEADVRYKAVDMGLILDSMDEARNGLNIIVLDACRNNPFARSFRSLTPSGLSKVRGPKGTLIAYATEPGNVALDGDGNNSPYTKHLVTAIQTPGLALEQTFKRVLQGVDKETSGKQTPWISSSFVGDFYFAGDAGAASVPVVPVASVPAAADPSAEMWDLVKSSTSVADFDQFLASYPDSVYAPSARLKKEQLLREQSAPTVAPLPQIPAAPAMGSREYYEERRKNSALKDSIDSMF